jgi:hypothetical protein
LVAIVVSVVGSNPVAARAWRLSVPQRKGRFGSESEAGVDFLQRISG